MNEQFEQIRPFSKAEETARRLAVRGKGISSAYIKEGNFEGAKKFSDFQMTVLQADPGQISDDVLRSTIDFMESELERLNYDSGENSI